MNYRSFADLSRDIKSNLYKIPKEVTLIVGIPRSGLLAASVLATYINLPYTDVDSFILGEVISPAPLEKSNIQNAFKGKILVIDDSIATGKAQNEAKERLKKTVEANNYNLLYCCVYVTPGKENFIDIPLVFLETPRAFEWNIYKHKILKKACVSIDGVLGLKEEMKDIINQTAESSAINAKPFIIPKIKIATLVSSNSESFRQSTVDWLQKYNVQYDELIMSGEKNASKDNFTDFKVQLYRQKKEAPLFMEGYYKDAMAILKHTGKDVFCVETNQYLTNKKYANAIKTFKKKVYALFKS